MTAAIFAMELRFRMRMALSAACGLIVLTAIVGLLFPAIGDSVGEMNIPEGLSNFVGGQDLASIAGWLRAEILSVYGPAVFAGVAIASASATIAGEEEDRILALVLAHPVPRSRLLLAKAAAIGSLLAALAVAVLGGMLLAVVLAGGGLGAAKLVAVAVHLWLFGLVVGALALALEAGSGRRGFAAGVSATTVLVMFLLNGLAPSVESLDWLKYLSVFHYYSGGDPITTGFDPGGLAVLVALTAALIAVALATFARRDLRG